MIQPDLSCYATHEAAGFDIVEGRALRPRSNIWRRAPAHGSGMYSCFGSRRRAASSSSCAECSVWWIA